MPMESIGRLPGKKDINSQFSRENIKTTLEHYKSLKNTADGDYEFGALTDKWFAAGAQWMSDVKFVCGCAVNEATGGRPPTVTSWVAKVRSF